MVNIINDTLRGTGADPGFLLGGGALVSCSCSTPINHIVFFFSRIPVVLENRRSSQGGRGAHPLHPSPRSAPDIFLYPRETQTNIGVSERKRGNLGKVFESKKAFLGL